jgi:hypothetical protein
MDAITNTSLQDERRRRRTPAPARDFLRSADGWRVVSPDHGDRGGMVAHRGVLHPDEYVDRGAALSEIERRLGFTVEQMRSVYRQGPLSAHQRELRGRIDARLLAVQNLAALARIVGVDRDVLSRGRARAAGVYRSC